MRAAAAASQLCVCAYFLFAFFSYLASHFCRQHLTDRSALTISLSFHRCCFCRVSGLSSNCQRPLVPRRILSLLLLWFSNVHSVLFSHYCVFFSPSSQQSLTRRSPVTHSLSLCHSLTPVSQSPLGGGCAGTFSCAGQGRRSSASSGKRHRSTSPPYSRVDTTMMGSLG